MYSSSPIFLLICYFSPFSDLGDVYCNNYKYTDIKTIIYTIQKMQFHIPDRPDYDLAVGYIRGLKCNLKP